MILHWAQNLSTSVASQYKFEVFFFRFTWLLRSVYRDTLVSMYRYVSWPPNIAPRCTGESRLPYKKLWRIDRHTDGRTDWTIHRAAWSQLKMGQNRFSGNYKHHIAIHWISSVFTRCNQGLKGRHMAVMGCCLTAPRHYLSLSYTNVDLSSIGPGHR